MATALNTAPPMQQGDDLSEDAQGADTGQDGSANGGDGGYVIEIRVSGDKQITVAVENGADEAAEESGAGEDDAGAGSDGSDAEDAVPCKSVKEALTLALEIFRADGQMPQGADDSFQQGFEGVNK